MKKACFALLFLAFAPLRAQSAAGSRSGGHPRGRSGLHRGVGCGRRRPAWSAPSIRSSPSASSITDAASGKSRLDSMSAMTLVQYTRAGGGRKTPKDAQMKDVTILDRFGNAAVVKVVATNWIDYLQVAKYNGDWKIVNVLWELKDPKDPRGREVMRHPLFEPGESDPISPGRSNWPTPKRPSSFPADRTRPSKDPKTARLHHPHRGGQGDRLRADGPRALGPHRGARLPGRAAGSFRPLRVSRVERFLLMGFGLNALLRREVVETPRRAPGGDGVPPPHLDPRGPGPVPPRTPPPGRCRDDLRLVRVHRHGPHDAVRLASGPPRQPDPKRHTAGSGCARAERAAADGLDLHRIGDAMPFVAFFLAGRSESCRPPPS